MRVIFVEAGRRRRGQTKLVLGMAATAAAAVSIAMPASSFGQNRYWVDGVASGNWNVAVNWASFPSGPGGAGVPGAADIARITHANATNYNVTLNANAGIQAFLIGNAGTGISTLTQSGAFNITTTNFFGVGSGIGSKAVIAQTAGTNTIGGLLQIGVDTASLGTYNLGGAGVVQLSTGGVNIGVLGTGVFNQTGGQVVLTGSGGGNVDLTLGANSGSTGTYNLSGGTLSLTGFAQIGLNSGSGTATGTFNQTGGTHNAAFMTVGADAARDRHVQPEWRRRNPHD